MIEFIFELIFGIAEWAIESALDLNDHSDTSWKKTAGPSIHNNWCKKGISPKAASRAARDMSVLDQNTR